jgi:hypothetical protein
MFIAIPSADRSTWVGHNLASLAGRLPGEELSGLAGLTKAVALALFRCRRQVGATQWDSVALYVHTRMGPLDLLTAWTPAHSMPWTITYRVDLDPASLRHLARDPGGRVESPAPDFWIASHDHTAMRALQARIEQGERLRIVGRPESLGDGHQRLPVASG